jgi:hypothetical protein
MERQTEWEVRTILNKPSSKGQPAIKTIEVIAYLGKYNQFVSEPHLNKLSYNQIEHLQIGTTLKIDL